MDSKINAASSNSLSELKRTDSFPFVGQDYLVGSSANEVPLYWSAATEKRAGGRTFPIEDDDSKEKRRTMFADDISR